MTKEELVEAAREARRGAYAPYSGFSVGAALLTTDGRVFTGCNVENVSFGLTLCAERVAVGSALAAGVMQFETIAIVSDSTEPVMPCGACRQVMAEFNSDLRIVSATTGGELIELTLGFLLPNARQGILG